MPGKKTDAPWELSEIERKQIREYVSKKYPNLSMTRVQELWEGCRDWHLKHGQQASSWPAAFRMWIRKAKEFSEERDGRGRSVEMPQEHAKRGEQLDLIGKVIEGVFGQKGEK